MKNPTIPFRNKAAAIGGALLISATWMAGIATLVNMTGAHASQSARPAAYAPNAAPILKDAAAARRNTIVVTAKRIHKLLAQNDTVAADDGMRPQILAAIYIPPPAALA